MSDNEKKKPQTDSETILMALDQIGQTIDVMTSVVGRLRTYLQENSKNLDRELAAGNELSQSNSPPKTLH